MPKTKNNPAKNSEFLIARDNRLLRYAGMSKNENLTAKNDLTESSSESLDDIQAIIAKIADENKAMREALEYYADKNRWRDIPMLDRGDLARKVLGKGEI